MKNRIAIHALLMLIVCAQQPAQALSLYEIELNSYLNETLDARIGLGGLESGDLDSLNTRT